MNNDCIYRQIQSLSDMYLASNPTLQCSYNKTLDLSMLRLYHIVELPSQDITMNLYAMENLLDSMQFQNTSYVYIIQGTKSGLHYYCGVVSEDVSCTQFGSIEEELSYGEETLVANLEVGYGGIVLEKLTDNRKNQVCHNMQCNSCASILEGVPGVVSTNSNAVGINRFTQAMQGEEFTLMLLAKPVTQQQTKEITNRLQNVTGTLIALQDYTKQCQQGSLCETTLVAQGVNSVANATNNLTSSQLQFQLYKADDNNPALGDQCLQRLEDAFFASDINNLSSLGKVFTTLGGISSEILAPSSSQEDLTSDTNETDESSTQQQVLDNQTPNPSQSQIFNPLVTRNINQNPQLRRSLFPSRVRRTTQTQNMQQVSSLLSNTVSGEGELREIDAGQQSIPGGPPVTTQQPTTGRLPVTTQQPTTSSQPVTTQQPVNPSQLDQFELAEEFNTDGLQSFSFTNLSKTDTKTRNCSNTRTCTNQISETGRKNTINTFTISQKITNQAVSSWNNYINDIASTRLNYGGSRGVYVYTTTLFSKNTLTLSRLTAAWRGMNMYDKLSKVPVKGFPLTKSENAYKSLVNFRLPLYYHEYDRCIQGFTEDEIIARSAYSQVIDQPFVYGGNWISSKELSYMTILPAIAQRT